MKSFLKGVGRFGWEMVKFTAWSLAVVAEFLFTILVKVVGWAIPKGAPRSTAAEIGSKWNQAMASIIMVLGVFGFLAGILAYPENAKALVVVLAITQVFGFYYGSAADSTRKPIF